MENLLDKINSIVIKVGTAAVTTDYGIDSESVYNLAKNTAALHDLGKKVSIVTSGAIAAGRRELQKWDTELTIPEKQTLASIGQPALMDIYREAFHSYGLIVGQVLVNKDDFLEKRIEQLKLGYQDMSSRWIVPIFNENDSVSVDEIKFSDNDNLQELIAINFNADLLINLTRYPGLIKDGEVVLSSNSFDTHSYDSLEKEVKEGRGGLKSKLQAMERAYNSGKYIIIGNVKGDILGMIKGTEIHTRFE